VANELHKVLVPPRGLFASGKFDQYKRDIPMPRWPRLAVTGATRVNVLPDVPPVSDFVPGYEASGWQGIGTHRNTPVEIIDKLNKEINAGLADPPHEGADRGSQLYRVRKLTCRVRRLHRF
jgi:hypothetical protein